MKPDPQISRLLRRRRILRWSLLSATVLIAASAVIDHTRVFGYTGSDQQRFDHQSVTVTRVIDGDTIVVKSSSDEPSEITVHLLGVDAPDLPDRHWSQNATRYTEARTTGRTL